MKTKPEILILLFCVFFSLQAAAQLQQTGNIVTNQGDTLHGSISYRDSHLNPRTIYFYAFAGSKDARKIYPTDIAGFSVNGEQPYVSFLGLINTDPTNLSKLLYNTDRHFSDVNEKKDTVFLRLLVKGEVSLYELQDFKFHYFIQYKDGQVLELLNKFYMTKGPPEQKVNNRIYLHQLDSFFTANNITGTPADLQLVGYYKDELTAMVRRLDGHNINNSTTTRIYKAKTRQNRLGAGAGISVVQFWVTDAPYGDIKSTTANPVANVYYDVTGIAALNKFFGRMELRGERQAFHANLNRKGKVGQNTQTLTNISFIPSINYSFIKNNNIEMYIGVAPSININLRNAGANWSFTYTQFDASGAPAYVSLSTEDHPIQKVWANVNVHAGLILQRKWDFHVSCDFLSAPEVSVISGASRGFNLNTVSLRLNYLFRLH